MYFVGLKFYFMSLLVNLYCILYNKQDLLNIYYVQFNILLTSIYAVTVRY